MIIKNGQNNYENKIFCSSNSVADWLTNKNKTNLSHEFWEVKIALALCAEDIFEKLLFAILFDAVGVVTVVYVQLVGVELHVFTTLVTVIALIDVHCGATDCDWFKNSPPPIIKMVDCESPPSSLADESSRV